MQQSLSTTQYDSTLISELASLLRTNFTSDEIQAAADKYLTTPWPKEYTNSDTGRIYKPHHNLEASVVYSDTRKHLAVFGGEGSGKSTAMTIKTLERLRRGCSGIMACVSADTLVDGIPIAERTKPALVNTTLGPAWASPSFCEGQADLFRVVTQSGDWVLATVSHRFLTPVGWRQLQDLHVGSLIAVDDSENGQNWMETPPGSLADCYLGLRPYDEYANDLAQYDRDKWLQLALQQLYSCHAFPSPFHACTDRFSRPLDVDALLFPFQPPCEVGLCDSDLAHVSCLSHQGAYRSDSLPAQQHYPCPCFEDSVAETQIDRSQLRQYSPIPQSIPSDQRCLATQPLDQTVQSSYYDQNFLDDQFLPCQHYTTRFVEIQEITFQKYGDFYGMIVPTAGHYSAQGIFHHNSPDLEHAKKSLWPEFKRWCPWHRVIERNQYMAEPGWLPREYFEIVFRNDLGGYSTLGFGGCPESDIMKWEGPNINFAHLDEIRRHKTAAALKVFTGRARITGPHGEPPQIYISTTPFKHWLYDYFGPMDCTCSACHKSFLWDLAPNTLPTCPSCSSPLFTTNDPWRDFKLNATVIRLRTQDNEPNLYDGFARDRAMSLTEAEARVLLDAEWEDLADSEHFLPSITLWDLCYSADIPPLSPNEPIVLAVDAAKGRTNDYSDCFAIVGVSRHWEKEKRRDHCVVRFVYTWQAKPGGKIELVADKSRNQPDGPEDVLRNLCSTYNVTQIAYDPYQMNDLGQRFRNARIAWMKEFGQISERTESDSDLLQLILSRRIVHNNDSILREHIENADRKVSDDGNKIRIVKRLDSLKVDAAVALSMACKRCLYLNIA